MSVLSLEELRQLPGPEHEQAGVYFLWDGDELVYIGKSKHLMCRYSEHLIGKQRPWVGRYTPYEFTRMTCLVLEDHELMAREWLYLQAYETRYNMDRSPRGG